MTIPDIQSTVKQDPAMKWIVGGVLLLIALGYFVFLYALYSRVTETDGYIQEFIEESLKRHPQGEVIVEPRNTDRPDVGN